MSGWFKGLFLFSSFGPLYALVALGLMAQGHWLMSIGPIATFFLALGTFEFLRDGFKRRKPFKDQARSPSQLDENIIGYLIAYLPPLLVDDFQNISKIIPATAFFVTVVLLLFKIDSIYFNPFFLIYNYRIYRVTLVSGRTVVVITDKPEIVEGDKLNLYEVQSSRVYYAD